MDSPEEGAKDRVSSTSESTAEGVGSNCDVVNLLSDDEDDCDTDEAVNVSQDMTATALDMDPANKGAPGATVTERISTQTEGN